jgi:hypothetical protein
MVYDILVVFLEVLPCFHMTVLSSSWVSWFSESLFSPRIFTGYPRLVGWAWTTIWRVERQKLYLTLSFLKGYLVLSCWSKIISPLWICYLPIFDLSLGYRHIKLSPKDHLGGVLPWFLLECIIIPFGLTNTFALFLQHMSPSSWSI